MNQNKPEYHIPSEESIQAFARQVCEGLAALRNDDALVRPDVISGFSSFIRIALTIEANHRNRAG